MLKQRFWVSQKHFIYKEKCGSHKRKINYDNLKSDTPSKIFVLFASTKTL